MSDTYKRPKSCTSRLFGTAFAFILAAAVVYIGSYLIVFNMTSLPAANESGWLGPQLRFLATGPYQDAEDGSFYLGDTKPYEVFRPLNKAWLQTQDLPTTMPVMAEEGGGGEQRGGTGEGRGRGEGRRRGEGRGRGEGREGGRQRSENGEQRERRGESAAEVGRTTETIEKDERTTERMN